MLPKKQTVLRVALEVDQGRLILKNSDERKWNYCIWQWFIVEMGVFLSLFGKMVKSKYCKSCEYWKKGSYTDEYKESAEIHEDEWQANHEGSEGKMAVDVVIEMFQLSEYLRELKYDNYAGDGDLKSFTAIFDS